MKARPCGLGPPVPIPVCPLACTEPGGSENRDLLQHELTFPGNAGRDRGPLTTGACSAPRAGPDLPSVTLRSSHPAENDLVGVALNGPVLPSLCF
jgi:hypothetical protein